MKKIWRVLKALINISLKSYLENRWNTLGVIFNSLLTLLLTVFFVSVVFSNTSTLSGWNKSEVILIVGLFRIVFSLFSLFFFRGVYSIPNLISKGELDQILTKPVNSQFLISFRYFRVYELFNMLGGIYVVIYAIKSGDMSISLLNLIPFFISLFSGIIIFYSIYYLIATFSIWFTKFHALPELFSILQQPLSFPTDIYGRFLSIFLTFILPLAFVVTVPAGILIGRQGLLTSILCLFIALVLVNITILFWKFALKYYSSASS